MRIAVTFGEITGKLYRLDVRCTRCDRAGRYRVANLIEQHGADFTLPELRRKLAADCPQAKAHLDRDRCDLVFPGLLR